MDDPLQNRDPDQQVEATVWVNPSVQAIEIRTMIRTGDCRCLVPQFHDLAGQLVRRQEPVCGELARLGAELAQGILDQDRVITNQERDFLALLVRRIVGHLEVVEGEGDDIDLGAWKERFEGLLTFRKAGDEPDEGEDEEDRTDQTVRGIEILNQDLQDIFIEECGRQLVSLEELLEALQASSPGGHGEEKLREDIDECVYTLCGNCRNLGYDEMAHCAEVGLGHLHAADGEMRLQDACAHFQRSLGMLRAAFDEIAADGRYSSDLADKLLAVEVKDVPSSVQPVDSAVGANAGLLPTQDGSEENAGHPMEERDEEAADRDSLEECRGILDRFGNVLESSREDGPDQDAITSLLRELHALKEITSLTGRDEISLFIHRVESLLEHARLRDDIRQSALPTLLLDVHGGLLSALGFSVSGAVPRLSELVDRIVDFQITDHPEGAEEEYLSTLESLTSSWRTWMPEPGNDSHRSDAWGAQGNMESNVTDLTNVSGELDLVRMQLINKLDSTRMNLELLKVNRNSISDGLEEIRGLSDGLTRQDAAVMTTGIPEVDEGGQSNPVPLLQNSIREVTGWLDQLKRLEKELVRHASDIEEILEAQKLLGDRLRSGLQSARLVTPEEYLPYLRYLVRVTARKAGKEVDLKFEGGDIQIDRQVIESMMTSLGHMIRNSVIHGVEPSSERQRTGKVPRATIRIDLSKQGSELVLDYTDDGAGIDLDAVLTGARQLGMADSADQVDEAVLLRILTTSGFTTLVDSDPEARRGLGLHIIYQSVRKLGGTMQLSHSPGQGVGLHFRLPASLAVSPAILIGLGSWRFAFRSQCVERLLRLPRSSLGQDGEMASVEIDGVKVPVILLRGSDRDQGSDSPVALVLVVRLVNRLAAFEVDEFIDTIELLGRDSGSQLLSVPEISGVTVLSDAGIVPIVDPEAFVRRISLDGGIPDSGSPNPGRNRAARILVVDDSAVVRTVMKSELESQGMKVETAGDGIQALEMLENFGYDVALIDIEMPRMDGLELLRQIRGKPMDHPPAVFIITSEPGEHDRERSDQLGADGFIVRPCATARLIRLINEAVDNRGGLH